MKKTYQLVDEYYEGNVYYLVIDADVNPKDIQEYIWDVKDHYYEWENGDIEDDEIEDGCFACLMDYVIYKVGDKFDADTLTADGTLYY